MVLKEIQRILKENASQQHRESNRKFIPSANKSYGVKSPILTEIVKNIKEVNFDLIQELWQGEFFEEKVLAVKILGKFSSKDPEKSLKIIQKFSRDISDWAVCDTLATQGIRKIAKSKKEEIFKISKKLIESKNFWQRRFALVLLIELYRQGFSKERIEKILEKIENDKEYYVKKAIIWLKKELNRKI